MPLMSLPVPGWRADLWRRMRHRPLLKFVGVSAFMWVFFMGYFHTLRHPAHPVFEMPLTALDHWIPFQPLTLVAYFSLWLYVGMPPGLMLRTRDMLWHGAWAAAMCAVGLLCFYAWPTAVPATGLDLGGLPGFALLRGVDAAGNACPSLHVAGAIYAALWIEHLALAMRAPPALRALNALWFFAIAYSTLATKQHVVLDVAAGALLGTAFALASIRWRPRNPDGSAPL